MKDSIQLTRMPVNYTGHLDRLEILCKTPDINEDAGIYLQHVSGCGYTVYELTAVEARFLGERLIAKANESLEQFMLKAALVGEP